MKTYSIGILGFTVLAAAFCLLGSLGCAKPLTETNSKDDAKLPAVAETESRLSQSEPQTKSKLAEGTHATVELTKNNFEELAIESERLVLVDFWASWCGPCLAIAPSLETLAREYGDKILIGKVNVDEQQELASIFRVSSIPALVYIRNGKIVDSSTGAESKDQIESHIRELLN